MASTSTTISSQLPKMDFEKIRKTDELPSRVSVYDLIAAIVKNSNARKTWGDLKKSHPEVVTKSYNFQDDWKFEGQGQSKSPVINARGAIMIINLLPGSMAASFRAAWADIIVRYIGGDETLKVEIERNNAIQNELPKTNPMRIFREDVEARHIPLSVTGVQDIRSAQIYFGIAGPPEVWTDIRRSDSTPYKLKENEFLMKTGYHDENTGRYGQHVNEYGFFRLSDSVLGRNPRNAEQKLKGWARNENLLLSARHANKTTRDTELIAVTLVRYKEIVGKAIEFFEVVDQKSIDIDYERELTKRMEEETKRAQIQADVQKMQIQLEMLRLEKASNPIVQQPMRTMQPTSSAPKTSSLGDLNKYEEYVNQRLIMTDNDLDRLAWNSIITDCQNWMRTHPVHANIKIGKQEIAKLKGAVITHLGRTDSTQGDLVHKNPGKRDPPKFKGWSRLQFAL